MATSEGNGTSDPQLAIANLDRQILHGPEYLDGLVCARSEEDTAIEYLDESRRSQRFTYVLLQQASQNLACRIHRSRGKSTQWNTIIPVILPQGPALYISYLGVLKAGAAFCPVLPDTPDERLRFTLHDVQAELVICEPAMVDRLLKLAPSITCIPATLESCTGQLQDIVNASEQFRGSSDIAYVMYTSGSTGKPKGVPVSHHAVTQSLLAHKEHIPAFQRFFQFAAPTFDVSIFEIFFTWLTGATLVSCERETTLTDLCGVLKCLAIDAIELTPTVVSTLIRKRDAVPNLRLLLTIGEMLNSQLIQEFGQSEFQTGILYAMYGPTEAAIHCTVAPSMETSSSIYNIGRPLSTVTAFILTAPDDHCDNHHDVQVCHRGEPGELAIAGQLADGYLNRVSQTKSAFVKSPKYGTLYRTGDRAIMLADGTLQILGRISGGQVKIRGQRVELGEIESVALQAGGIDLAIAIVAQDTLVLFCSGQPGLESTRIEQRCKAWLPRHMRPGSVIVLDEGMPRLPSGKIDRKALEHVFQTHSTTSLSNRSDKQENGASWIRDMVEEELGIVVDDNCVLRLSGLTSIRAIKIASKLRQRYPQISISAVLEAETVAHLVTILDRQNNTTDTSDEEVLNNAAADRYAEQLESVQQRWSVVNDSSILQAFPCSNMQNAMLAETSRNPALNFNKIVLTAKLPIELPTLLEAFEEIARRNSILRSAFESTGDPSLPFVQLVKEKISLEDPPSMHCPLSILPGQHDREFEVTIHHALYDGWSWDLIMRDVNAYVLHRSVSERPSFQTFSQLMARRSVPHHDAHLMEWTELLQHAEFTIFPTLSCPHPSDVDRAYHSTCLSTSQERLSTMAVNWGVNMATIVHAVLSLLLAKYLDSETVVTGLVLSGREPVMSDVEEVIGPCLVTLPLLARVTESSTMRALIQQVYREYIGCLRRAFTPLSDIANALSLSQDARLFDVLFVWQESPHPSNPDIDAVVTTATQDHLEYAIVVEVEPKGDSIHLRTTYDIKKLSLDQISCIHSQLEALVANCARDSNISLDDVWNELPPKFLSVSQSQDNQAPDDLTSMLSRAAFQFPTRTAIEFVEEFDPVTKHAVRNIVTYKDLYARASHIATKLVNKHKVGRDDIVAICCKKSPELYFVICATILAGVAYLCIDPNTPEHRINDILHQASPRLLVREENHDELLQGDCSWSVLNLGELVANENGEHRFVKTNSSGSDLAYAVFTSGSTGSPKGVLITRANLAANLHHLSSTYPYKDTSRLLQSCSQAFDVSVFEIFWTWCNGLTLCSTTNDILFRDLETFINALDITHLSMTPSVAALVNPSNVPKVEFLVCAGEPMSAKVYGSWASRGLQQGYGPSETTNICNVRHYTQGSALINNVGPPFPNTSVFVCGRRSSDRNDKELSIADFKILPRGANGELWIGGQQVGRGYTDPELTKRSFLDHPTFGRLFKSGDFGRMLPDDSLIITGREDDQVKIRGQRVELKEVDLTLRQSDNVKDSFTTIVKDENDRQKLVTFWVQESETLGNDETLIGTLYDMLRDTLPSYMVPESLIPLPNLPLTSQSKIDRHRLVVTYDTFGKDELAAFSPDQAQRGLSEGRSETEQIIVDVLADMVTVSSSEVKVHISFFNYGIDSIRAIAFTRRLREAGLADVEVSSVLKHASVTRLASALSRSKTGGTTTASGLITEAIASSIREHVTVELEDHGFLIEKILPCTPLQAAMLSANDISTDTTAYQNHLVYRLTQDPLVIKHAWEVIMTRVDILRTMFALTDDTECPYVQIVLEKYHLPWSNFDRDETVPVLSPLEKPPYSLLLKSCASHTELHLFIHHALYDAEAMTHLQNDIETICLGGKPNPRPSFSRYLEFMVNINKNHSEKYWKLMLRDFTPSLIARPRIHSRNTDQAHVARSRRHVISWTTIAACAKELAATPLTIFQTSLARLLASYTTKTDVCFGTVFSGRNVDVRDVDKVIGPCFNTLPSRIHLRSHQTNRDTCRHFHAYNVSVLPYQAVSLRNLQQRHGLPGNPLFDVLLLCQPVSPPLDARVWNLFHENGYMAFPFILEVQYDTGSDAVHISLHADTSSDAAFLESMLDDFINLVDDTVKGLNLPVFDSLPSREGDIRTPTIAAGSYTQSNGYTQALPDTLVSRKVIETLRSLSKKTFSTVALDLTIFHLGLDSLSTIQLAAKLRKHGFQVSAGELLDKPNIYDIIKTCEQRQGIRAPSQESFDLEAFDREHRSKVIKTSDNHEREILAVWPCTATQLGILSEYVRSNGKCYYNSIRLRLGHGVDLALLREKLQALVEIHEMLRTGFVELDSADMPYAMVLYSRVNANIKPTRLDRMRDQASPVSLPDISEPPWHVQIDKDSDDTIVELHMLHALYDAKSLQTMLHDLAALYRGSSIQQPISVSKALSLIVAENKRECSLEELLGCGAAEAHTTSFPDLNILKNVGSRFLKTSLELSFGRDAIQSRCGVKGCNMSAAFQAVWARLLAAYTGQSSVVFGSVFSGRFFEEDDLNEAVFPCINTLPIVVNFADAEVSVIEQVTKANACIQKNPHTPLTKIKRACGVEGNLFDTLVVLHQQEQISSDPLWQIESESASAEYTISLEVIPINDKFTLYLTFNEAVLPLEHAAILLKQYEFILYESLDLKLNGTAAESQLYSARSPRSNVIQPDGGCLHDLVLSTAAKFPERVALELITGVDEGFVNRQTWTYQQAVAEASRVANLLVNSGSCTNDMIGICCEKSAHASFALLGILMAGCTYVAIDPSSPTSRKAFIIQDAKCKILLTTSSAATDLEAQEGVTVLRIDDDRILSQQSTTFDTAVHHPSLRDTCYCLYTSGTTGTPKGCLISHQSAVQAMNSFSRIFEGHWTEQSRWLQFASYHFDVSVLEHFWSWKEGICVSIVPRDLLFEDLPGTINKVGITHLDLTPSLARLLTPESVPSLCQGVFIVGGEQVRQEIIQTWGDTGCLYNFYGPSEVTIGCTVHAHVQKGVKATNIGNQWDNVGTLVLEPGTEDPVLVGAVGELCLSGVLVGKGYLNRPELSAEKFITLKTTGERVYRTGDLVRMLHDYSFEFLGRIDSQVKLRGQRLEIGEINHTILQCCSVIEDAATLVVRHPQQEKPHVVAFLARKKDEKREQAGSTIAETHSLSLSELRNQLSDRLPGYMIPTYLVTVDSLPLTVNNKADLKALESMYRSMALSEVRAQQQPKSNESSIDSKAYSAFINMLAKYLGMKEESIEPHDSLLQLGIDSVSAIGLMRALRTAGYTNVSVPAILQRPIVADLAAKCCDSSSSETEVAKAEHDQALKDIKMFAVKHKERIQQVMQIEQDDIESIAPCTALQDGMISKLLADDSERTPYMTKFVFNLDPDTDLARLLQAWDILQAQLDILRTHFVSTNDGFAQVVLAEVERRQIHGAVKVDYGVTFILDDPLETIDSSFKSWAKSAKRLNRNRPWQVSLTIRYKKSMHMSIFMFHGLYDGISMEGMLKHLHRLYEDPKASYRAPLFYEALSYGPLLRKHDSSDFWIRHLPNIHLLALPISHQVPKASRGVHESRCELMTSNIDQVCSSLGVTSQAVFHAAWILNLARKFGVSPTIGIVLSGRSINLEHAGEVIGPMFNTLPFGINQLPKAACFTDMIQACHRKNINVLPYQHTAISTIRKALQLHSQQALFDSLFVYQISTASRERSEHRWTEIETQASVEYPLNLEIEKLEVGQYSMRIVADARYLDVEIIRDLLEQLKLTLESLPGLLGSELPACFSESTGNIPNQNPSTNGNSNAPRAQDEWTKDAVKIRAVLAELAGINDDEIGLNEPTIFELGLDSVDALKLAARIRDQGIRIPVGRIMRNPTISGILAQHRLIQHSESPYSTSDLPFSDMQSIWRERLERQGITLQSGQVIMPTTPLQQGMLLEFEHYYHTIVFSINGADILRFIKAIHEIERMNAILRTRFVAIDEDPPEKSTFWQLIGKPRTGGRQKNILYQLHDMDDLKSFVDNVRSFAEIVESTPRLDVIRLKNGKNYLVLGCSHASYDAWSIRLIIQNLQKAYTGNHNLTDDTQKIAEYVHGLEREHKSPEAIQFWSRLLKDAAPSLLPTNQSDVSLTPSLQERFASVPLEQIQLLCKKLGITMQSLGIAVWATWLMMSTQQLDISFGLVVSGRVDEGTESLVFPTFNTVILRTCTTLQTSKHELLQRVHNLIVEMFDYQQFPLSKALDLAHQRGNGLFNTLFTFQKLPATAPDRLSLLEEIDLDSDVHDISPPYPVNVELQEKEGKLAWTIAIQQGVMSPGDLEDIFVAVDKILESLTTMEDGKIFEHKEGGTSVCGLPSIEIQAERKPSQTRPLIDPPAAAEASDSKETGWSLSEAQIRDVFAEVSGSELTEIRKNTSLYHLGLDSVSAIRISKLLRRSGLEIPVSMIVRHQTVEKIASAIIGRGMDNSKQHAIRNIIDQAKVSILQALETRLSAAGIANTDIEDLIPTIGGQDYMLDMWRASKGRLFYATFSFEVQNCDQVTFSTAFDQLIREIPALRTKFVIVDGKSYQVVFKPTSGMHGSMQYELTEVSNGLVVALHIHHALYDAISLDLIVRRLKKLCSTNPDRNSEKDKPFVDSRSFVDALQLHETGAQRFWTQYLRGVDKSTNTTAIFDQERTEVFVPDFSSSKGIQGFARKNGVSGQAVFFATMGRVYAHAKASTNGELPDAIVVGTYLANRSLDVDNLAKLMAPTFNIVPLKIKTASSISILEAAKQVQADMQEITRAEHCGVSLRDIHKWTGVRIDCYINFLRLPDQDDETIRTKGDTGVEIKHAKGELREHARALVQANKSISPYVDEDGLDESGIEWCLPALDVEARIEDDGTLAVGMFAPSGMFDEAGISRLMEALRTGLSDVAES